MQICCVMCISNSVLCWVYSVNFFMLLAKFAHLYSVTGHIFSRVYNCTECQKFPTSPFFGKKFSHSVKISQKGRLSSTRISDNLFFSHLPQFSPVPKPVTTAHFNFLWPFSRHSLDIFRFSTLFSTLTLTKLQLQLHIIHLLQLQMTFYNCRNCNSYRNGTSSLEFNSCVCWL